MWHILCLLFCRQLPHKQLFCLCYSTTPRTPMLWMFIVEEPFWVPTTDLFAVWSSLTPWHCFNFLLCARYACKPVICVTLKKTCNGVRVHLVFVILTYSQVKQDSRLQHKNTRSTHDLTPLRISLYWDITKPARQLCGCGKQQTNKVLQIIDWEVKPTRRTQH